MKLLTIFLLLVPTISFSAQPFARVLVQKGKVEVLRKSKGKYETVRRKSLFYAGDTLRTGNKSFLKILTIDKSSLTLGPSSEMILEAPPEKKPGVVKLLSGVIQAKIRPDLKKFNNKNKFFIRTKTASLGVRGTEFVTNFNPKSLETTAITYSGEVVMAAVDLKSLGNINIAEALSKSFDSSKLISVKAGELSVAKNAGALPSEPIKLSPIDMYKIKNKLDKTNIAIKIDAPVRSDSLKSLVIKGDYKKINELPKLADIVSEEIIDDPVSPASETKVDVSQKVADSFDDLSDAEEISSLADMNTTLPVQNVIKINIKVE